MRRIKFIIVHTKRGLKLRSKQSLRIIYKNNKNKIFKNRKAYVMDIFNSFFFEDFLGQFTLSVIFLTLLGRHRKSAQLFLVSFPDILQTARLTARFWRDIELYLWVITPYCAFRLPEIGGFFQSFHLPMRFDCRKTSVLEREGGRTCDISAILLPFREIGLILSERFVFPSYAPFLPP